MDILNLKKVEELEKEVKDLKRLLREAESDLNEVLKVKESIPKDCIPGPYCAACEFGKEYYFEYVSYWNNHRNVAHGVLCNKANVCGNFTKKEVKNNV